MVVGGGKACSEEMETKGCCCSYEIRFQPHKAFFINRIMIKNGVWNKAILMMSKRLTATEKIVF